MATNRLLRQYFPRGTRLDVYSQTDLDLVANRLTAVRGEPWASRRLRSSSEVLHRPLDLKAASLGSHGPPAAASPPCGAAAARPARRRRVRPWPLASLRPRRASPTPSVPSPSGRDLGHLGHREAPIQHLGHRPCLEPVREAAMVPWGITTPVPGRRQRRFTHPGTPGRRRQWKVIGVSLLPLQAQAPARGHPGLPEPVRK